MVCGSASERCLDGLDLALRLERRLTGCGAMLVPAAVSVKRRGRSALWRRHLSDDSVEKLRVSCDMLAAEGCGLKFLDGSGGM